MSDYQFEPQIIFQNSEKMFVLRNSKQTMKAVGGQKANTDENQLLYLALPNSTTPVPCEGNKVYLPMFCGGRACRGGGARRASALPLF